MKEEIRLGQFLVVDHFLSRTRIDRGRFWQIIPSFPKEVIVVGVRTLHNGKVVVEDDCKYFESKEKFKALLVVENLKNKPFYVKINS